MLLFSSILLLSVNLAVQSPVPSMVKYDQRQEGEWNVRADLENFVILILPTSTNSATAAPPALSLLDLLSKAVPRKHQKRKHVKKPVVEEGLDAEAFIESKTAPYHVDISRSRSNLAKLHPDRIQESGKFLDSSVDTGEKLLVSPTVSLHKAKHHDYSLRSKLRFSRGFVVAAPVFVEEILKIQDKDEKSALNSEINLDIKKEIDNEKSSLNSDPKEINSEQENNLQKISSITKTEEKIAQVNDDVKKDLNSEGGKRKKVDVVETEKKKQEKSEKLTLIGAEHEQCGPGYERDGKGICRSQTQK